MKNITKIFTCGLLNLFILVFSLDSFASQSEDFLIELGKQYFNEGRLSEATIEFKKALILDPDNNQAKEYLNKIHYQRVSRTLDSFVTLSKEHPSSKELVPPSQKKLSPKEKVLTPRKSKNKVKSLPVSEQSPKKKQKLLAQKSSAWSLKGDYQTSFGIKDGDFIWKRANYDLNEENFRNFSNEAFNLHENTFDPAIFSQFKFNIDYSPQSSSGWSFHSLLDISPWSFIGKSKKITLTGSGGDSAEFRIKYWANTGYTVNETVFTQLNGDSFSLPEMKVVRGRIRPKTLTSIFSNTFSLSDVEIDRQIWPLRQLNFAYQGNTLNFKVFPVGMEDEVYSSDDPLGLTNHHIYWEESQWLVNWKPGHFNSGSGDFFKGFWDDSLAFFTRDSSGIRLTALRGLSFNLDNDKSLFNFTVASPKELWQDYQEFNTWQSALRAKYKLNDRLSLGLVHTSKWGYSERSLDAFVHTAAFDSKLYLNDNSYLSLEIANSRGEFDKTTSFKTKKRGWAFNVNLVSTSVKIEDNNYNSLSPAKEALLSNKVPKPFYKLKLSLTHMDRGFRAPLSDYRHTRQDQFWSRHLTFREPFKYYYGGLYKPGLSWDDVRVYRIGDGVDYGRDVINFRWEGENFFNDKLDALFDIRNVHNTNGKYIENVSRLELTYRLFEKLTAKFLGIYHDLPPTVAGVDPFLFISQNGDALLNSNIKGGEDPTLKTVSLGLKYDFTKWWNLNFIWERTNDATLAYDNFPRGLFTWTNFSTYQEYGNTYRKEISGLYDAGFFPLPPYPYFDIFKVGLGLKIGKKWDIYLDYTRNEYAWAQIIDDNMNHIGLEIGFEPLKKLGFYLRYVYSRANDISTLNDTQRVEKNTHHNAFSEMRLMIDKTSELITQYGVGTSSVINTTTFTPFGGGVPVLDLVHIFRIYYRKTF